MTPIQEARLNLNAQLVVIRLHGEPVKVEDLRPPPIADADNAATDLIAALACMNEKLHNEVYEIEKTIAWTNKERSNRSHPS